jgi:hypothetical protein
MAGSASDTVIRQVPVVDESSALNTTAPPATPAGRLCAPKNIVTINEAVVLIW